jgi:predicted dehydrogenase
VNGEHGSIAFDLEDAHQLQYFDHREDSKVHGWRNILVTDGDHPYMSHWWVPGCVIGYEHTFVHAMADFLEGLDTGKPARPTFRDALETQRICDAVLKSAKTLVWEDVGA